MILILLGQKPNSIIKAWTETADWTFSQKVPPQNIYYDDLIVGNVLRKLVVTKVSEGGFQNYMKSIGKLGGQNKIARLSNDRSIADKLV